MKKLVTILITITMIITMAVPGFAYTADQKPLKAGKPAVVQNLKVIKNGYRSLRLTWQTVDGADKYQVYRSKTGKKGSFALKKTTTATTYTNSGIICGRTYYYKVRAVNAAGKGAFSAVKSSRVQPAKAMITDIYIPWYKYGKSKKVTESYGSTKVTRYVWDVDLKYFDYDFTVKWKKVAGATGYQLYMREKGKSAWKSKGFYKSTTAKGISFNDQKEYEFKVRAYRNVNGKKVYGYFSKAKSFEFQWDMADIKAYCVNYIKKAGKSYKETYIDDELGYEVVEQITPANSSWSFLWPTRVNRYRSLDYETSILYTNLQEIYEEDVNYCIHVCDATTNASFNPSGNIGRKMPLYYEVYLCRM